MENGEDIQNFYFPEKEKPKIFREKAITGATFLGGPLAAGYVFFHNYRIFGEQRKAKLSITIGVLVTCALLLLAFLFPQVPVGLWRVAPFIQIGVASLLIRSLQGPRIAEYLQNGGQFFNGWRVAGVGLISGLIIVAIMLGFLFNFQQLDPLRGLSSREYGIPPCHIYYDAKQLTVSEVDYLSDRLTEDGYFRGGSTIDVLAEREGKELSVTYTLIDGADSNPATIANFKWLRDKLQEQYPEKHVTVKLSVNGRFDEVKETIK